jgi:hypothetical protein
MDGMSDLLNIKPMSDRMLLHMAAVIRAEELKAEFIRWQARKQREDTKYLNSILKAWMKETA